MYDFQEKIENQLTSNDNWNRSEQKSFLDCSRYQSIAITQPRFLFLPGVQTEASAKASKGNAETSRQRNFRMKG